MKLKIDLISLAFVQHDEIKEEIVKQNYFYFLIRCATQADFHVGLVLQISLEIIWTLTFNDKIHQMLASDYENFITYLKTTLINSKEQGVQAAAKGILWKLENESIVKKQIIGKDESSTHEEKYDVMISYSHSNKELCFKIHEHLSKLNYRIWLDFENMYGSTLQSMAEAIESSDIILLCMSNSYKQSAYCQSEAEYAFTRQRHIIPIVMEKKYRPDGWLGFICASKMYVDFTKTGFDQAFQKLISQIELRQRKSSLTPASATTRNRNKEPLTHDDGTTSIVKVETNNTQQHSPIEEQERLPSGENNYHCQYIEWWTHEDVLNFLREKQLDTMLPLFEKDQQFDGHSLYILYEQCQSNIESTYQILNSELSQNREDTVPYLTYIRFLRELEKQSNPINIKQSIRYFLWIIWRKIHQKFFSTTDN